MEQEQIQLGQEYRFDFDDRYFTQTAERAMKGDVVRGMIELITNSDDSYGRLEEKGRKTESIIKLSIERKRRNSNTIIKVLDYAEGMTLNEMLTKLKRVGGKTSGFFEAKGQGMRGAMGRGAKECVVFGELIFESIKDGIYSKIELKKPCIFKPIEEREATETDRLDSEIHKGNGTLVTMHVESRFSVPNHHTIHINLPKYYSLRDIVAQRKFILINTNTQKEDALFYREPPGRMVFDEKIIVPDYPKAIAHVVIKRADNRIPINSRSPYWEGGFIVKSNHAIHGITSLNRDIENNPYFEHYFGRITCPYVDELFFEYEECEKNKQSHTSNNPVRIIDPLREEGLASEHPFTKALYSEIAKHVKSILKKHEEEMGHRSREIENEQTKKRHQKLASEVSKFLKEHIEDLESHEDENYLVSADIPAGGMRIVPEGLKVPINKTKKVYIYVKPMAQQEDKHVLISSESSSIKVNSDIVELIARGDGILTNSISLTGLQVATDIKVKLVWNNVVKKFISVSVVLEKQQALSPLSEFQFEKQNYTVREGKEKKITILAQWPEFIHGKVILKVTMTQNEHCKLIHDTIALDYDRTSSEKYGKKFATGVVKVKGMKAGGPVLISAILQNKEIVAKIRVTKEFGQKYKIELIDEEEYGTEQRAFLLENVIKINGRHKIIQRYLGQREKWDDTQNSMHVRLLIAELVADIVARKILESKSQKNSNEYSDMDVTGFYKKHRQYVEKFLEIAHYIQIPNHEISQSL